MRKWKAGSICCCPPALSRTAESVNSPASVSRSTTARHNVPKLSPAATSTGSPIVAPAVALKGTDVERNPVQVPTKASAFWNPQHTANASPAVSVGASVVLRTVPSSRIAATASAWSTDVGVAVGTVTLTVAAPLGAGVGSAATAGVSGTARPATTRVAPAASSRSEGMRVIGPPPFPGICKAKYLGFVK